MSAPNCAESATPDRHVVQCYGADSSQLIANVSDYLSTGAEQGDSLLVIATARHADALIWRPASPSPTLSRALADGTLLVLDARRTLSAILLEHHPDADLFDIVVGGAIRQLQARRPGARIRAFGEMVGILWQEWEFDAAIRLEAHWNRLLAAPGVSLFCSYPVDIFGIQFDPEILEPVLCAHSRMMPGTAAHVDVALDRALDEALGKAAAGLRSAVASDARWATLPRCEAKVLWLRANLPNRARDILQRARSYCQFPRGAVAAAPPS